MIYLTHHVCFNHRHTVKLFMAHAMQMAYHDIIILSSNLSKCTQKIYPQLDITRISSACTLPERELSLCNEENMSIIPGNGIIGSLLCDWTIFPYSLNILVVNTNLMFMSLLVCTLGIIIPFHTTMMLCTWTNSEKKMPSRRLSMGTKTNGIYEWRGGET